MGGAELIAHEQAKQLARAGCEVAAFAGTANSTRPLYSMARTEFEGIPIDRVKLTAADFEADTVNFANPHVESHFEEVLAEWRPEIVHFHNLAGLSVRLIEMARNAGARTVLTLHDHWGFCFKTTLLRRQFEICSDYSQCAECLPFVHYRDGTRMAIEQRNQAIGSQFHKVDAFISPSLYLASAYIRAGIPVGRIHVIANGVDAKRFSRVAKTPGAGRLRLTYIGYLGHHKGVSNLIDAIALLESPSRVLLHLVGEGASLAQLRDQVRALNLTESVRFWGRVENSRIESVYAETDVLILPSICPENQPVSITEAMACHTPVIAARIGGIPEQVTHGENGFLFDPASPRDLADRIRLLFHHPELLVEMGENGWERIAANTFANQAARILRLYERLR